MGTQILTALIGEAVKQGKTTVKTKGVLTSLTTQSASVGGLAGLYAVDWNAVLNKDPAAIGTIVLIVFAWIGTVIGRWRAGVKLGKAA